MGDARFERLEERIRSAVRLGVDLDAATGKDSLSQHPAGFAGALVGVGEDGDVAGIGAAAGGKQACAGEFGAVPFAEEPDELISMVCLDAGCYVPFRPRRGGELVKVSLMAERRTNTVAREHHDKFQMCA